MTGTVLIVIAIVLLVALIVFQNHIDKFLSSFYKARVKEKPFEKGIHISRFHTGWGQMKLPIIGVVTIIDKGNPGVGLSAMQMDALGVGRGIVLLGFNGKTCEAKVWNAFGPDATRKPADIRITNSVARKLSCGVDDEIVFLKVVEANLPVEVS